MMRAVILIGGPADGQTATVDGQADRLVWTDTTVAVWTPGSVEVEERVLSPMRYIYAPRRRGDYGWYFQGER